MIKRIFDVTFSVITILLLSPVLFILCILILSDSKGGIFYKQKRVGLNNKDFIMFKFRTMKSGSDKKGLLTVGNNDSRITRVGKLLRITKLDELPQLFNVFIGKMSIVGPRPEVRKFVELYSESELNVLKVKPGITDPASIFYKNENEILASYPDPEQAYIEKIMRDKLRINLEYISRQNFLKDLKIIFQTIYAVIKK